MRRANSLTAAPKRDAFARESAVDRTIQRDGIGRMRPASFRRRDRPAELAGLISASLTVLAGRSRNNAAAIVIIACVLPSQPTTTMPGTDGSDQPGDPTSTVACRAAQSIQSSRVDMIQTSANEWGRALAWRRAAGAGWSLYESSDMCARPRLPVSVLVNLRFGRILEVYRRGGRFVRVSISAWPRTRPLFLRGDSGIFLTMPCRVERIDAWLDDVPVGVHDIHAELFTPTADNASAQHAFAFAIALPAMRRHDHARQGSPDRLHYCDPCHAVTRYRYRRHCRRGRRHVQLTGVHVRGQIAEMAKYQCAGRLQRQRKKGNWATWTGIGIHLEHCPSVTEFIQPLLDRCQARLIVCHGRPGARSGARRLVASGSGFGRAGGLHAKTSQHVRRRSTGFDRMLRIVAGFNHVPIAAHHVQRQFFLAAAHCAVAQLVARLILPDMVRFEHACQNVKHRFCGSAEAHDVT